jgi:class 3 adenylate cyclase/predicted ATPase
LEGVVTTIADFLVSLGLAEYAAGLYESGIDVSALPSLTEQDLEKLGIPPADRKRLLSAVAQAYSHRESFPERDGDAERRHLTILFCDLVGSTELSTRLDPEALNEIISRYRKCCARVFSETGGFLARYLGDGVLAYFGYPRASEDDAERAVNAGLRLVESVGQLHDDIGRPLQVRVGIASGLVLIGDLIGAGTEQRHDVVGETPNLAARLQTCAEPNTVVISGETRQLVRDLFEYAPVDTKRLKGFAMPIGTWRVIKSAEIFNRFRALRTSDTPLVGRELETDLMVGCWEKAKAGNGRVLLISSEPGVGKSRIVQALRDRLKDTPHVEIRVFCAPHRQGSALYPIIRQLQRATGIGHDDTPGQKLNKLEATLSRAVANVGEVTPLIAELLSISTEGRFPPLDLSPQKRREKTLQALIAQLEGLARQPTLMVFEDVHWIDPTSLELLSLVVDRAPNLPLLLAVTFRPEFTPPWLGRPCVEHVRLDRLPRGGSAEMIANLTRDRALSNSTVEEIIDRTEGVPLFIEELTKILIERGSASPPRHDIPATLRDMLTARLDRLGQAKQVAQIASVLGPEFSAELLHEVMSGGEDRLNAELRKLVAAELLFDQSVASSPSYRFKHALIQEAAYQSLVRSKREEHHRKVAETLKARFPEIVEAQPELVAHHYTGADLKEAALPYWQAAAANAMRRSANLEAIAHLTKAQEQLLTLPESPERLQRELALQLALGTPLIATRGFASPEVGKAYERAHEICKLSGDAPQLFPIVWGLWVFYIACAEHGKAHELAHQCRRIAKAVNDTDLLILAHHAMGVSLTNLGQFDSALSELNQGIEIYNREEHAPLAFAYGQDPGVVCRAQAAFCLWFLGLPEQALKRNDEALALAQELSHPYSLAAALDFSAWIHQLGQNVGATEKDAEAAIAISAEREFVFWLLIGMILRGWALTAGNKVDEGIALMRQGVAGYQATGAGIMRPYYLALVAEALAMTGELKEALRLLDEAEAAVRNSGERWYEAELYRHKGRLMLQDSARAPEDERRRLAEDYFERALVVASQQGAKLLELRAAAELCRLWSGGDKGAKAKRRLAEVYGRFQEGFDLKDLRDAYALLQA